MTFSSSATHTLSKENNHKTTMMSLLNCWKIMNKQRKYLRGFKPYQLNDIGLSQQQAYAASKNPFWQ